MSPAAPPSGPGASADSTPADVTSADVTSADVTSADGTPADGTSADGVAAARRTARRWRRALWLLALAAPLGMATQGFLFPGRTEWPVVPRQLHAPVILITVPGLRADRLGHLGHNPRPDQPVTPNLDLLARHGVSFTGAYVASNESVASAAALLTGLCPRQSGVRGPGDVLPAGARSMAEVLHDRGYYSAAFVADPALADAGLAQGFDVFETAAPGERAASLLRRGLTALRTAPTSNVLLWIDLPGLQRPYGGPDLDLSAWEPDAPADFGTAPELLGPLDTARLAGLGWGPAQLAWMSARYDAALHALDADIGGFIDALADDFRLETLTLCVTATRGERLDERAGPAYTHGLDLYEPSVRVPLLLRLPARHVRSLRLERLASSQDVAPTLLELGARVMEPERALLGSTGLSLADDITRLDQSRARVAIEGRHGDGAGQAAALVARAGTGLYKLILAPGPDGGQRRELYLLESDPDEWQDMAAARPLHADKLEEWLQLWLDDCSLP